MFTRIDPKNIESMIEDSKQDLAAAAAHAKDEKSPAAQNPDHGAKGNTQASESNGEYEPLESEITIDDFAKIDLRGATIIKAEQVEGAKKLLRLELDLGFEQRQVFAGIKSAYKDPLALIGKQVIVVANLKARQMKFGLSQGMIMAAGPGGEDIFLLSPDAGAKNGDRVH